MLARRQGVLALEAHVERARQVRHLQEVPELAKVGHHAARSSPRRCSSSSTASRPMTSSRCSTPRSRRSSSRVTSRPASSRPSATRCPGIGIVAAVLGIIVTMGHMDAPPAEIGHHVAAALVGTFLGILLCYGVLQPLANNAETQETHQLRFLRGHQVRGGRLGARRRAADRGRVRPQDDLLRRASELHRARQGAPVDQGLERWPSRRNASHQEGRRPRPPRRRLEGRVRRLRDRDDGAVHGALAARVDGLADPQGDLELLPHRHPARGRACR